MSLGTLLLIVLILMLIGAIPSWPHSRSWGYGPSGLLVSKTTPAAASSPRWIRWTAATATRPRWLLGLVVVVILVLLVMGRL